MLPCGRTDCWHRVPLKFGSEPTCRPTRVCVTLGLEEVGASDSRLYSPV